MPTRTMQKIARAIALTKSVSCRPASEPMRSIMAARAKRLMPNIVRRRLNFSWTVIARYSSNEKELDAAVQILGYGRGGGVERTLGVSATLGVKVGVAVRVAVGDGGGRVGVTVGIW